MVDKNYISEIEKKNMSVNSIESNKKKGKQKFKKKKDNKKDNINLEKGKKIGKTSQT